MNKKLYIVLIFGLSLSCILSAVKTHPSLRKLKPVSALNMRRVKPSLDGRSEIVLSPMSSVDNRDDRSTCSEQSPSTMISSASESSLKRLVAANKAGVSLEQYNLFAKALDLGARGEKTLSQALAEQHEREDTRRAAPRLVFAAKVKASQRAADKAAQDARDAEEDIKQAQKIIVGCPIS